MLVVLPRKLIISVCALLGVSLVLACTSKTSDGDGEKQPGGQEAPVKDGFKRFHIRFLADDKIFDENLFPKEISRKKALVNGISYQLQQGTDEGQWYVDVEQSSFGVYSAQLIDDDSSQWYGSMPTSDIFIPSVQFLSKKQDLSSIPLVAEYDPAIGDYLDFSTPYAVLDFVYSGDAPLISLKLSSSSSLCGFVTWKRSERSFVLEDGYNEVVLNCTGLESAQVTHYPVMVLGGSIKGGEVRVCDRFHKMFVVPVGDLSLEPGTLKTIELKGSTPNGLMWFEGFDLCVWGGDAAGGKKGLSPSSRIIEPQGDDILSGYEYARTIVEPTIPGSAYVQRTMADQAYTVAEDHGMTDSYIASRCFADYKHMLRCRECPGYISAGTGGSARGLFSLFPLTGINSVKNIEVSFRLCLDQSITDDFQLMVTGSSSVIKEWFLDGIQADRAALSQKGTSASLTVDKATFGGCGVWKTVKVIIDNCTDATLLQWMARSYETGNHAFYLDEICIKEIPGGWNASSKLRVLYWNIQNGMWANQYEYDDFVAFVRRFNPDICVWCEARSNYQTGSDDKNEDEQDAFLPARWPELAARYGHGNIGISRRGNEWFPQVITSKYPIEKLLQIGDIPGQDPVMHGAGIFKVAGYYFVTLHLNPYSEEDLERYREISYIMQESVQNSRWPKERGWLVLGDFNSHSRADADFLPIEEDSPKYKTHDYIISQTGLVDLIATRYPGCYVSSTYGQSRFDYIYMDEGTFARVCDAGVLTTQWTTLEYTGISNFYIPSDHRPILVDINY